MCQLVRFLGSVSSNLLHAVALPVVVVRTTGSEQVDSLLE
jgi:nucleotide-binding universal stress UspA family protein